MKFSKVVFSFFVLASVLVLLPLKPVKSAPSGKPRIVDRLGVQISSVFYGIAPIPKVALEWSREGKN